MEVNRNSASVCRLKEIIDHAQFLIERMEEVQVLLQAQLAKLKDIKNMQKV